MVNLDQTKRAQGDGLKAANDELNSAQEARKVAEARVVEATKVVKAWSLEISTTNALAEKAEKFDAAEAAEAVKTSPAGQEHEHPKPVVADPVKPVPAQAQHDEPESKE